MPLQRSRRVDKPRKTKQSTPLGVYGYVRVCKVQKSRTNAGFFLYQHFGEGWEADGRNIRSPSGQDNPPAAGAFAPHGTTVIGENKLRLPAERRPRPSACLRAPEGPRVSLYARCVSAPTAATTPRRARTRYAVSSNPARHRPSRGSRNQQIHRRQKYRLHFPEHCPT